jgi:hypothetical protein
MVVDEGYLVVKTVRAGKAQVIMLLPPVEGEEANYQKIICNEAIKHCQVKS